MPATADDKHWLDPPEWWRKVKPVRWVIGIVAILLVAHHFHVLDRVMPDKALPGFMKNEPHPETEFYTRVEATRVPLADRFSSYDDLGTVTKILSTAGYEGWTTRSRYTPRSSAYPPYNFDMVTVKGYRHLEEEGELTLSFFNTRLFEAEFVPTNAKTYSKRLRALNLRPRSNENARAEKIEGDLRVTSTVELSLSPVGQTLHTQPFVIWQDLRLIRARASWDAKFGGIPIPAEISGDR
jgi:hypothetical protein